MEDDIDTHKEKGRSIQVVLNRFRQSYNHIRPHESLGMKTPADVYAPSPKRYPTKLRDPDYKGNIRCERANKKGEIFWKGKSYYLSKALAGELIGIDCDSSEFPDLNFGPIKLGTIYKNGFKPRKKKSKRKNSKEKSDT